MNDVGLVSLSGSVIYIQILVLQYLSALLFDLEINTQLLTFFHTKEEQRHGSPRAHPTDIVADVLAFNGKWHSKYLITLFIEFKPINYFGTSIYFTYC